MKNLSESAKKKADKIGEAILTALQATSVQYAASYKGEIVASGSVGRYNREESRSLSKDDMYGVGSTSKMFVTASAMLLSDQGLLDIDEPYKNYVPEFEMADPRYVKITARHLMNHASGIYGTHFKGAFLFEDNNTFAHDNLREALKTDRLKYDPGTFSEYCNDGFQLLEILVERVGGLPYNEFLKRNFFEPLGMRNTVTPLDDYDCTRMVKCAAPQIYDGDLPYETVNLIGTGGIVSTAEDLCRFGRALMGKQILSEKAAKMMAAKEYESSAFWPVDEEEDNLFAYGLGYDHAHVPPFDKVGLQALCKGGDTLHYHASLIVIPEADLAAAAVSAGGFSFADYCLAIELLKDACLEYGLVKEFPPAKSFEAPEPQDVPAELKQYEGLYAARDKFADVQIKDGAIELEALLGGLIPPQKYVYAGNGRFVGPDGKNAVHFVEVRDDLTFLQGDIAIEIPGVGMVQWKAFLYQKLEKNPVNDAVAAVWKARDGRKYILVNDFASSMNLLALGDSLLMKLAVNAEYGYAGGGAKIVDENYAENALCFRDVCDYRFYEQDGAEYLAVSGYVYMDASAIPQLKTDTTSVTIGPKGYARFFTVDDAAAGKTIAVKTPATGAFGAYGEAGEAPHLPLKTLSTVMGGKPIELAEGDTLAFAGNPGDSFEIELK